MTDPTNDYTAAWRSQMEQPTWKPRHRVDPMRPANPHIADPQLEHLYQQHLEDNRVLSGRTGPNLTIGLIIAVIFLGFVGLVGAGWWAYAEWLS